MTATTSSRLRILGGWMLVLGLIVGFGAFAILQLSQDKIDNARLNFGPDEYAGTVTRCWITTGAGLLAALIGAALVFLNPKGGELTKVQLVAEVSPDSSVEERLAEARSLFQKGVITDAEHQEQRKRILDQV